jgi:hypothetical protein
VRYAVESIPARAVSAFTPSLTRPGIVATRGLTHVVGFPGTELVPVESPGLPPPSFTPKTAGSSCAPDAITPDIYEASPANMGPFAPAGAARIRWGTNEIPIAALGWQPVAPVAVTWRPRIGGRRTIGWPRVSPSFPPVTGTG